MSTAKFDTLANLAGSLTVPVATVVQGSAKAWVNFNGTGTVAIRAAFNVSSITDNGTGDYTVNFTTALPNADYSAVGSCGDSSGRFFALRDSVSPTTSNVRVQTYTTAGLADALFVNVIICD